jgi:flagellar motor switch protein FliM
LNEKTLKQDEIDALFEAARSSRPEAARTEVRARVVPYNFSSAGQISTEQLRAISMLNDLFARNVTHNLSAWLRTRFQVNLVSAEQMQFNDFLLRIPEISYVASVRLEPLGALSVMQLDLGLAPPMIDLLLGGEGKTGPLRELTDIEESILGSVVEIICRELTAAWQPVGLSFNFERRQMQTQVARIISVNEKTLCLSFEIRMPHSSGLLNLAFPAVVANTILRRLTSDWSRRRHHAPDTRARMEAHAKRIVFGCSLQLPTVRLAAKALENLEAGDVLRLDLAANVLPVMRVGGQILARANAARQGPHRAARIERQFAGSESTEIRSPTSAMAATGAVEQGTMEFNQ